MLIGLCPDRAAHVVDQDVDTAPEVHGLLHRLFATRPGFEVDRDRLSLAPGGADRLDHILAGGRTIHDQHASSFACGALGDTAADALCRPSHDHDLVVETAVSCCFRLGFGRVELLEVEICRLDAQLAEMRAHCVDHRRRTAKIDVAIAVVQVFGSHVVGDKSLAVMIVLCGGQDRDDRDVADLFGRGLLHAIQFHQVSGAGHGIVEHDGLIRPLLGHLFQHRQKRCQSGPARQPKLRTLDRSQVKSTHRAGQRSECRRACACSPR